MPRGMSRRSDKGNGIDGEAGGIGSVFERDAALEHGGLEVLAVLAHAMFERLVVAPLRLDKCRVEVIEFDAVLPRHPELDG